MIILEKAKDAAPIILKMVKETALTVMKKVKKIALTLLALSMVLIPWIMLILLSAALPPACNCRSVKLPECPVARSEEPACKLMNGGVVLWFIFTCGTAFFCCQAMGTAKENSKKVKEQGIQTETATNEIV